MECFNFFDGDLDELSKLDLFVYEVSILCNNVFNILCIKYLMFSVFNLVI